MVAAIAVRDGLTTNEVAAVASVPSRHVRHMIEAHFFPDEVIWHHDRRPAFKPSAAVFVAFDIRASNLLTADARRTAISDLADHFRTSIKIIEPRSWKVPSDLSLSDGFLKIDAASLIKSVAESIERLFEAKERVVRDPEILSGTPVLRGTRIPVYDIAASVDKGISKERILRAYSDLTIRDIELAHLWAKANPPMGRPKRAIGPSSPETTVRRRVTRRKVAAEV